MKQSYKFVLLISLIFTFDALAQGELLNGGFENWNNGKATHWLSTNIPNDIATNVTQTSDAHSGAFAVRGEVQFIFNAEFVPGIFTGYNESLVGAGFPVTQKYSSFSGYYKFIRGGNIPDEFHVLATLTNESASGRIAEAEFDLPAAADYTFFEIPFVYDTENLHLDPEVVNISIVIDESPDGEVNQGSVFYIDDLELSGLTGVGLIENSIPAEYALKQNYPNPFNPTTKIEFSIPKPGNVTLQVYNMLGEKVTTLVNEHLTSGSYSADFNSQNLSSGTYIYKLTTNNFSESKKMIVLK